MIKRLLTCVYDGVTHYYEVYIGISFFVLGALLIALSGLPKIVYLPLVVLLVLLWVFWPGVLEALIFEKWSKVVYEGPGKLHVKDYRANHSAPGFEAQVTVEAPGLAPLMTIIRHGNAQYLNGISESHDVELVIKTTPRGQKWVELIQLPSLKKTIIRGDFMQDM